MGKRRHLGRALSLGGEQGSELVEFALILVPLALLLFGIIQYGFIFAARMTIRNATVIADRAASLGPHTNNVDIANIQNIAKNAVAPLLDPNNVVSPVNVNTNALVGGTNAVSVQLQYNLHLIIPWVVFGTNISDGHITLSATTVMR